MQLGFVTAILPEFDLDQVLAFAAAERFACVEAMCWPVGKAERKYAGVTHVDVTEFTRARADGAREPPGVPRARAPDRRAGGRDVRRAPGRGARASVPVALTTRPTSTYALACRRAPGGQALT